MDIELNNCPFCGGTDIEASFSRGYEAGIKAQPFIAAGCFSCGATGPSVRVSKHSTGYQQSADAWNNHSLLSRTRRTQERLTAMNTTAPEVIEKWRTEFVSWMQRKHLVRITFDGDSVSVPPINGRRQGRSVPLIANVAWHAWKEARQSLHIELPKTDDLDPVVTPK